MNEQWLSTQQAADLIGYHPNHIRKLIRTNKVKARKFSDVWQIDRASLLEYTRTVGKLGEKRGPKTGT